MKRSQPTCILGGLLICGMGLGFPGASYAITGCTNANLLGTYTADLASANLLGVLNSINPASTPGTNNCQEFFGNECPPAAASTGTSAFLNSPFGPAGSNPYATQYYFDGQGNILGPVGSSATPTIPVGTYNVNPDCSATISLAGGATFNAVLVGGGAGVLFMQNNAGSGGAVGTLQRAANTCIANSPQSLGFSYFGAQKVSGTLNPVSAVGQLQLNGQGGFVMQEWLYQYGKTTALSLSGTYIVASDCSLNLTFAPTSASSVTVPLSGTLSAATGTFIPQ
jgi:hypothetical protein